MSKTFKELTGASNIHELMYKASKRKRKRMLNGKRKMAVVAEAATNNVPHVIASDEAGNYIIEQFLLARALGGKSTLTKKLNLKIPTKKAWQDFVFKYGLMDGCQLQMSSHTTGYIKAQDLMLTFNEGYEGIQIKLLGSIEELDAWTNILLDNFEEVRCVIEWYYSSDGDSTKISLSNEQLPIDEMYPWLGQSLTSYYDDFMASKASILLLIGPPGTGKTTWIKGLLHHTSSNAIVTYDPVILSKDYVFAEFISGETNVMVIEDADNFLRPRDDGNDLMHKFLNVGSGLISNGNKKLIFSTNLPNIRDIDEALLRPGRCYDVLNFEPLNQEQAKALAKKAGIDINSDSVYNNTTVAEVFNQAKKKKLKSSMGFI